MRIVSLLLAGLVISAPVSGQITGAGGIFYGEQAPATCSKGDVLASVTLGALLQCVETNTWAMLVAADGRVPFKGAVTLQGTSANHARLVFVDSAPVKGRIDWRNGLNNSTDAENTDFLISANAAWVDGVGIVRDDETKPAMAFQFENSWPTGVGSNRQNEINWTTVDANGFHARFLNFIHRTDDLDIGLATYMFPVLINLPASVDIARSLGSEFSVQSHAAAGERTGILLQNNGSNTGGTQLNMNSVSGVHWTILTDRFSTKTNDFSIIDQVTGLDRLFINADGKIGIGTTSPTSRLQVTGLPVYADNNAALLGGLTVGAFYRGCAGADSLCVVH